MINPFGDLNREKKELFKLLNSVRINPNVKLSIRNNIKKNNNIIELKQARLILDVIKEYLSDNATKVVNGAHVVISDDGDLYDRLRQHGTKRISSHHIKDKPDSDLSIQAGNIFRELLIGRTEKATWFQLESHALNGPVDWIMHGADYLQYCATGNNIGQYGQSNHTDKNPIIVDVYKDAQSEFDSQSSYGNEKKRRHNSDDGDYPSSHKKLRRDSSSARYFNCLSSF